MKLELIEKRQEAKDVFSFIFQAQKPISWQAGQFIVYKIPHDHPDNRGDTRIFTISSSPYQGKIMLTTRYFFDQSSSFKQALFRKDLGSYVEGIDVKGHFTVENANKKLAFIAGGIGITPFHAILLDLEEREKIKDVILIYSSRDKENIVFRDTMKRLENQFRGLKIVYLFSPQHCDLEMVKKSVPDIQERTFYLSGPTGMVKSVEEILHQLDVDRSKIKRDYLPGYN